MTFLAYAVGEEGDGGLDFAIVADDDGFEYVWPSGRPADPAMTQEGRAEATGTDTRGFGAAEWRDLAVYNALGTDKLTEWQEVDADRAEVARQARRALDEDADGRDEEPAVAWAAARASEGMPAGFDEDDDDDPGRMLLYVAQALGEIDPGGPNGYILRALDGEPAPGDDQMYPVLSPASPAPDPGGDA